LTYIVWYISRFNPRSRTGSDYNILLQCFTSIQHLVLKNILNNLKNI